MASSPRLGGRSLRCRLLQPGCCTVLALHSRCSLAIACLAAAAVSLVGLIFLIKVTKLQALKITGSYIGFVIGYSIVVDLIFRALGYRAA
jgi:hypothetical protein